MNDRDCDNCAHHSEGGCSVWECSFEQKDDDTISRQAAIDAVSRGCQEFRGIFAECEKNLNELPSAQQWIPCSEKLPEDDEQVFVYLFDDSPYIAWFCGGRWRTEEFTLDKDEEPAAWMSLPKPYKEEE